MGVLPHPYLFFEFLLLRPGLKDRGEAKTIPVIFKDDAYSLGNDLSFQKRISAVSPRCTYGVYLCLHLHLAQVQVSPVFLVLFVLCAYLFFRENPFFSAQSAFHSLYI